MGIKDAWLLFHVCLYLTRVEKTQWEMIIRMRSSFSPYQIKAKSRTFHFSKEKKIQVRILQQRFWLFCMVYSTKHVYSLLIYIHDFLSNTFSPLPLRSRFFYSSSISIFWESPFYCSQLFTAKKSIPTFEVRHHE